jgi:hypothetical protein
MEEERNDEFTFSLGLDEQNARKRFLKEIKNELDEEISNMFESMNTVIISSEHFHSRLAYQTEVERLKKLLDCYFTDYKVIVYLRRQDLLCLSLYSTALREGFSDLNIFPEPIFKNNLYYNFELLLNKWATVFGEENIVPVIFEKEKLIGEDLITDFFTRLGIKNNEQTLNIPSNSNKALSWQVQLILLSFNRIYSTGEFSGSNNKIYTMREKLWEKLSLKYPGKSLMPERITALGFYEIFKESNKNMGSKWFNSPEVFSNDFSTYPEVKINYKLAPGILDDIFEFIKNELLEL